MKWSIGDRRWLAFAVIACQTVFFTWLIGPHEVNAAPQNQCGAMMVMGVGGGACGSAPVPTFVSDTSWNSTDSVYGGNSATQDIGALAADTTTCTNTSYTDCIPYGDPTLAGNLIIVAGKYNNGSASSGQTLTAADRLGGSTASATANSYGCTNSGSETGDVWGFICYSLNTVSADTGTVRFGTSGTVHDVVGRSAQFANIAASSALDGSMASCAGTSSTSANCTATVTPSQANDLIWVLICPVSAPNITSFTPQSGFTAEPADLQYSCDVEWEVDSGTSGISPSATFGSATSYVKMVAAFKASSSAHGSTPSGMYLAHMLSWNSPSVTDTTVSDTTVKFPSTGNLLVMSSLASFTPAISSVSDTPNTWTTLTTFAGNNGYSDFAYVTGATTDSTGTVTINLSGTGNGTWKLYDYINAPGSPTIGRGQIDDSEGSFCGGGGGCEQITQWIGRTDDSAIKGSNIPLPNIGVTVLVGGQEENTSLSMSGGSDCVFDGSTQGGENLSGPWIIDQNNIFGHCTINSATTPTGPFVFNETNTTGGTTNTGSNTDWLTFTGSSGMQIVNATSNDGAATTSPDHLTTTIPADTSGNLLFAVVDLDNATARTTSTVCTGTNTTCSSGTQLVECSLGSNNTTCAGAGASSHGSTSIWALQATGGDTAITIVPSGSTSHVRVTIYQVAKGSGSWSIDSNGAAVSNGTGSGAGVDSGPSFATGHTPEVCVTNLATSGTIQGDPYAPASGSNFFLGGAAFVSSGTDASTSQIFTSTGTYKETYTDGTNSAAISGSILCAY